MTTKIIPLKGKRIPFIKTNLKKPLFTPQQMDVKQATTLIAAELGIPEDWWGDFNCKVSTRIEYDMVSCYLQYFFDFEFEDHEHATYFLTTWKK